MAQRYDNRMEPYFNSKVDGALRAQTYDNRMEPYFNSKVDGALRIRQIMDIACFTAIKMKYILYLKCL